MGGKGGRGVLCLKEKRTSKQTKATLLREKKKMGEKVRGRSSTQKKENSTVQQARVWKKEARGDKKACGKPSNDAPPEIKSKKIGEERVKWFA